MPPRRRPAPSQVFCTVNHSEGRASQRVLVPLARHLLDNVAPGAILAVTVATDAQIRTINLEFRGKDTPTDVLSFGQAPPVPGAPYLLGDIVISLDTARRQATEIGHTLKDELAVLLVHGILHLLGHDHESELDARRMAAEEARLLALAPRPRRAAHQRREQGLVASALGL